MATTTRMVQVSSVPELDSAIASYVAQGYVVSNRSPEAALMFKKNEFNIVWAVVGFLLCILPLLVYLIVYATQSDQMVEIRVVAGAHGSSAGELQMSPDRHYWWNGSEWRPSASEVPPAARRSDDGQYWWDGVEWRPTGGSSDPGVEAPATLWAAPEDPEAPRHH